MIHLMLVDSSEPVRIVFRDVVRVDLTRAEALQLYKLLGKKVCGIQEDCAHDWYECRGKDIDGYPVTFCKKCGVRKEFVELQEGRERKCINERPSTPRPQPPKGQGIEANSLIERLEAVQCVVSKACTKEEASCAYEELDSILNDLR